MNGNLSTVMFALIAVIILPLLASLLASYVGNKSQDELIHHWGFHSQQWLGGLGVIIHELGHLIMALVFNHHIDSFKLLRLRHSRDYPDLGHVDDSWNRHHWYQNAGNFLIGIAPFYSCSTVLYLLQKYLLKSSLVMPGRPTVSTQFSTYVFQNVILNLKACWLGVFFHPLNAIIFILFMIMISTLGYALSRQDKHTMYKGLIPWSAFWVLLSFVISFWNNNPADFDYYIWKFIVFSVFMAINSVLYILLSLIILRGFRYFIVSGVLNKALHKSHRTFLRR